MAKAQEIPEAIGPYHVDSLLGEGGMGVVYRGVDETLDRPVAIKVLKESVDSANRPIKRFLREGRLVGRIHHQNVCAVYLLGRDEPSDKLFIAMEYINGKTLRQVVKERGPLPVDQAVEFVTRAAEGLSAALSCEVIHRDVKPGNIMVTTDDQIKVMDFGLAKLLHMRGDITRTGQILGTFHYLSPEALAGDHCDHRADIYGLGLTLYYLLSGQHPFETEEQTLALKQRLASEIPDIRTVRPDVPAHLASAIEHMTAMEAQDRPNNYRIVISLLQEPVVDEAVIEDKSKQQVSLLWLLPFFLIALLVPFFFSKKEPTKVKAVTKKVEQAPVVTKRPPPPTPAPTPLKPTSTPLPAQTVAREAKLNLEIRPSDGKVFIDDKLLVGKQRESLTLKAGTYLLRVERQGYVPFKDFVKLDAGDEKDLFVELQQQWHGPPRGRSFTNSIGMEMVWIPAGSFTMGSPLDEKGRYGRFEQEAHPVTISRGFWMSKYETTQENWDKILGGNQSYHRGPKLPVDNVLAKEAEDFCWSLSAEEKLRYRLPTEAEWEYACRAGSSAPRYGPLHLVAWYKGNSNGKSQKVGHLQPNDFGLHDVFGNVGELCRENWSPKLKAVPNAIDPQGATGGAERTARGFSWNDPELYDYVLPFRAALRWPTGKDRNRLIGFRPVCIPMMVPPGKKPAHLLLSIKPDDTEAFLDGFPLEKPYHDYVLSPGLYQLLVQKSGHETHQQFVKLTYGEKVNVDIILKAK